MEDLRSSRRPAKPAYADVFCGGANKYSSAPCATAKADDYAEIFGGLAASCSIPFLDLPYPSAESYDTNGSGPIDYSEIFGGFSGGGFAVDYEDLFRKTAETSATSNGRVRVDTKFGQHTEGSDLSSVGARKDYGACFEEKNNFSSSSNQSDDDSKQFSMSYDRTTRGSVEDVISGKTHITQLHAVPGYTYMINSCPSQDVKSNNSPHIQTNDLTDNVSRNGRLNDLEQEKRSPSSSFTDYTNRDGADSRTHQKEYSTEYASSEDDPVNEDYHSCSSSNYSGSSGDIPYPDLTYVSISEINLLTQPSRVPPPSRAAPKLASKQEHTKSHQIHYRVGASKSHGVQGVTKDVEVDAGSVAAASAAAMKEAMEQAQARLNSAKELMERKQDNLRSCKKLGHKEGSKYDERKEVIASVEEKTFSEVEAKKPLPKGDKGVKEFALDDMQKVIKVGKAATDREETEIYVATAELSPQIKQGNGFKSSQMSYKSEEVSGEWKTEEQFYELINNEKKFKAAKEASKQEGVEKNTKTSRKVNEDKENGSEKDELANEFRTARPYKVSETIQRNEIDDRSKACNLSHKEEIGMTPEKENRPEDISSSLDLIGNNKIQVSQDVLASGEEKKPNAGEETLCGENEMNNASSHNTFKLEEIYHDDEGNWKLHIAEEGCDDVDKEKELSGTHSTSAAEESEILKMFKTGPHHVNESEIEREAQEKVVELEEVYQGEDSEYSRVNDKHVSCSEENDCKLEGTSSDSQQPESAKLHGAQGACMPVENDLKGVVIPDDIEVNLSSLVENTVEPEAPLELQLNEKKQNADHVPSVVEDIAEPGALGGEHADGENRKLKECNGVGLEEKQHQVDAAQEVFLKASNKTIGDVQKGSRAENEGCATQEVCRKSRCSSHDPQETLRTVVTENSNPDLCKRETLEHEKATERETEYEKEQARKLEEEREREMEREKDRLAIERGTRETHERALAEARERAERIAVERVTAEARQRALAEAQEKAERASAEALEKLLAEKALKEAKLRTERAAVERATAEARERAVERALAEKVAADARQRAERLNPTSRDKSRNDNETRDYFRTTDKEDREIKLKTNFSGSSQRYADSSDHGEVDSPLRCKARLERHQRTGERAAKALAEKNMRDILAQREQAERNRLAESLDAEVRRWSTGKEGNLRALLSTLQYILGPESGWQPIPLTDVITAVAVKKAYRKATLYVHPDKLQQRGASIQQKYICEKVFDLLKEAWDRFNSEER